MGVLEIVLLAAGAVIFIASFCIPVRQEKLKEETKNLAAQEVKALVEEELENVRDRLSELSEEEMDQQIEKSERSMERISNEKIMAISEYSDTVLDEIHKNHEEVVFLYDILKEKKERLSESYGKAEKDIQDLLQQLRDSEITVRENLMESEGKKKDSVGMSGQEVLRAKKAENVVSTGNTRSKEEKEIQVFSPFVPEKVEVVPKKKAVKKTAENAAQTEAERTENPVPDEKKAEEKPAAENAEQPVTGENSNKRILELHGAGMSNMAIARELGLGVGEVKLVIDLYEGLH